MAQGSRSHHCLNIIISTGRIIDYHDTHHLLLTTMTIGNCSRLGVTSCTWRVTGNAQPHSESPPRPFLELRL